VAELVTDEDGRATHSFAKNGNYQVTATLDGYTSSAVITQAVDQIAEQPQDKNKDETEKPADTEKPDDTKKPADTKKQTGKVPKTGYPSDEIAILLAGSMLLISGSGLVLVRNNKKRKSA